MAINFPTCRRGLKLKPPCVRRLELRRRITGIPRSRKERDSSGQPAPQRTALAARVARSTRVKAPGLVLPALGAPFHFFSPDRPFGRKPGRSRATHLQWDFARPRVNGSVYSPPPLPGGVRERRTREKELGGYASVCVEVVDSYRRIRPSCQV